MQYIIEVVNTELGENYNTIVNGLKEVSDLLTKLNKLKEEHVVTVNPINYKEKGEVIAELIKELKPKNLEFGIKKNDTTDNSKNVEIR